MKELILLFIGLFFIVKAADVLVTASSSLALKLKVPKMLVALTIMAFGTCAPEVAISFQSVQSGDGQICIEMDLDHRYGQTKHGYNQRHTMGELKHFV